MTKDELYSAIESAIVRWNIDGTKTAGYLTREIISIVEQTDKSQFKTSNEEIIEFTKRCVKVYWEHYANRVHPDNQKDWDISQQIINK